MRLSYACIFPVLVPPIIDEGHTKVQAIVNHGAVLSCDSQGLPEPETSWEKDGEIFPTTGLRHKMQRFGSMEFISVRLEDAGIYRCTASNEAGNVSREIQLDVQGNVLCVKMNEYTSRGSNSIIFIFTVFF